MTPAELEAERKYRITERLGVFCGPNQPEPEQIIIAEEEADSAIEELRKQNEH